MRWLTDLIYSRQQLDVLLGLLALMGLTFAALGVVALVAYGAAKLRLR